MEQFNSVDGGEGQWVALLDGCSDAIFIGTAGHFTYLNPSAVRLFGADAPQQLLGKPIIDHIHPNSRADFAAGIQRLMDLEEGGELAGIDLRLVDVAGVVEISATLLHFAGAASAFVCIREVSERQDAFEALRRERLFLRQVIDGSPNLIFVKDRAGRFLLANRALADAFGATVEEVQGRTDADFNPNAEEVAAFLRDDREVMDSRRRKLVVEEPVSFRDGSLHWYSTSKTPLFDADGQCNKVLGVATEISAIKRVQQALNQSLGLVQAIIDNSTAVIFVKDLEGRYLLINRRFSELFHVGSAEMIGRTDHDLFAGPVAETVRGDDRKVLAAGEALEFEEVVPQDDGPHTYISLKFPLRDAAGLPYAVCGIATDITERRRTEESLRIAATAFESQEGVMITDRDGVIIRVNPAFTRITGYTAEEAIGRKSSLLKSGRQDADFYAAMWASIAAQGSWQGEIWNRRKNGEAYPEWLTVTAVRSAAGEITHYVGMLTDISLRKSAEEKVEYLAFYDPLTGLPNRRLLLDRVKQGLAASNRSGHPGALLFIDLDNFKSLNDTCGHDIGDQLLQHVAQRILACVREGDTVARFGGDEFVVMLEGIGGDFQEAASRTKVACQKILATLNQRYLLADHPHHGSSSIGATLFKDQSYSVEELMTQADLALHQAKAAGRNTFRFFNQQMQADAMARATLETDLRLGLERNEFLLHYQSQVDEGGALLGAEVLVRWQHPRLGLISPADFIPLAEETGAIVPLGEWILKTACARLVAWSARPETAHLSLAVNVSASQFCHRDFVDSVLAALDQTRADPHKLKLELTESLMVKNVAEIVAKMAVLEARGVRFSLDDFGTGYSSLSYLKQLPLDQLKIDKAFVRDVLADPYDAAIARTIIALAGSLGLEVIAEGVETEEQRAFLIAQNCKAFQGYLFGRPLPIEGFEAHWAATRAPR